MKKLFIITGEYSGDKHAANVVKEIKKLNPDIEIEAIGGKNLEETGVKLYCNHSKMSAVGFNFKMLYAHILLGKNLAKYLKDEFKPDLVLMVDYGGFNLNLSKLLAKYGIKMFYYIPPQIWASRKWRLKTVKKNISKVITIFPFETDMYKKAGIDSEFAGHPLIEEIPQAADKTQFFKDNGLDETKKLISIFPGSRVFEVKNLLEIFLKAAEIIHKSNKNIQFVLCQAPTIKDELILPEIEKYKDLGIKVLKNKNYELLSVSDSLMLASGTVALEAALYSTPMIISYKGPWFLYFIYLMVRCVKRVCLPNIIENKDIVPELVQSKAKPEIIARELLKITEDTPKRQEMISSLTNVKNKLSSSKSAVKTAQIIENSI